MLRISAFIIWSINLSTSPVLQYIFRYLVYNGVYILQYNVRKQM